MTFFYPYKLTINNDMDPTLEFAIKSQLLQQSLSQTLTHFYPLAGRFKNDSIVDCNDNGVIFIESRTNSHLSDFLSHPDFTVIDSHFLPSSDPQTMEMSKGSMLLFRFILFGCGGTAISCSASHKIMDLLSFVIFLRSWSSTCCGTTVPVFPDLNVATSRLPSINEMSQIPASVVLSNKKLASRRKGTFRPSIFIQTVNLRPRMDPPLPQNAMGNLAWLFPLVIIENEKDLEFVELVKTLMATRLSLENKVKEFKGEGIVEAVKEGLKEREEHFE
ncbi:vinorine synthase-like [Quillaja saponaria]|uniref:Vinorine synthase-like n=1 Tax=Quillaja saponaria TaxID=32244 RepID=A0AAD7LWP3_QUISA|nr:vinorine synthase-like [Quillaja saponaria]